MRLMGMPASEGAALAQSSIVRIDDRSKLQYFSIKPSEIRIELELFHIAVKQAAEELAAIHGKLKLENRELDAEIIEVQLFFLQDAELLESVRQKISSLFYSAQMAVQETMNEIVEKIDSLENPYLQQRATDLKDVCWRMIRKLRGEAEQLNLMGIHTGRGKIILLCEDLTPSEAVRLKPEIVAGLVTAEGGSMSHVAIIARSLGIPAVVGVGAELLHINNGEWLLLNGTEGTVQTGAYSVLLDAYKQLNRRGEGELTVKHCEMSKATLNIDITVLSNISSIAEARIAKNNGSSGVGLFRTEFLFMGREDFPTEEEQFEAYKEVVSIFGSDAPIIIRTMDVGGDKQLCSLPIKKENNPFLGLRGIRVSLRYREQFRIQIRAILRASFYGQIKLLFPMIATIEEWKSVLCEVERIKADLRKDSLPFNEQLEVGVLVEVPAVAILIDRFLETADFISIGTNDLTQYVMAVSRTDTALSQLHDPLQPAMLQLIRHIISEVHAKGKKVSVCGEMASHPLAAPLLLGLGVDMLSVNCVSSLPSDLFMWNQDSQQLQEIAEEVLALDSSGQIEQYLRYKLNSEQRSESEQNGRVDQNGLAGKNGDWCGMV